MVNYTSLCRKKYPDLNYLTENQYESLNKIIIKKENIFSIDVIDILNELTIIISRENDETEILTRKNGKFKIEKDMNGLEKKLVKNLAEWRKIRPISNNNRK